MTNMSLLPKWLPSINTSSSETEKLAYRIANYLELSPRNYRKMLSKLRARINVLERQLSANEWNEVNYEHVPSKANKLYRKAFGKHDATRYGEYLAAVVKGEKKINTTTMFPHELIAPYFNYSARPDATIEAMWKKYDMANFDKNALVVADTSGSMSGVPIQIALSLAIMIAEHNTGAFKDHFITFSSRPQLVKLEGSTLWQRLRNIKAIIENTNIQAVFELILAQARRNNLTQKDMPEMIFIVSDMQFDACNEGGKFTKTNHEAIKAKYAAAGYTMPQLVYWNVNSSTKQTPVTMHESGTFLVSGNGVGVFELVLNTKKATPYELMLEILNGERYKVVGEALADIR